MAQFENFSNITWVIIAIVFFLGVLLYWFDTQEQIDEFSNSTKRRERFECGSNPHQVILYYASWCPVCQQMYPEWEKFKKNKIEGVEIKEIRCEGGNETTCFQKNIKGYPTIILYLKDGREIEFKDYRTADKMLQWVRSHI